MITMVYEGSASIISPIEADTAYWNRYPFLVYGTTVQSREDKIICSDGNNLTAPDRIGSHNQYQGRAEIVLKVRNPQQLTIWKTESKIKP